MYGFAQLHQELLARCGVVHDELSDDERKGLAQGVLVARMFAAGVQFVARTLTRF